MATEQTNAFFNISLSHGIFLSLRIEAHGAMLAQGRNVAMARPLNCLINEIVEIGLMTNTPAANPELRLLSGQPAIAKPFYVIELLTVNDWKFWHFCFFGVFDHVQGRRLVLM